MSIDSGNDYAPYDSEEEIALTFAEVQKGSLRYVPGWRSWMIWDGQRWQRDAKLIVFSRIRWACRQAAREASPDTKRQIASAHCASAVERLVKADERLTASVEQWDANPWLLNTPAGTIDLKDGSMRPHAVEDFITKVTKVAPSGECPRFIQFLSEITSNNADKQTFLKRVSGYGLTGSTCEHALFFHHGPGGNGKGTFISATTEPLGEYVATASMDVFIQSNGDRHPTELAALCGARVVIAQETDEGRQWAESKIKALTGGDKIAARFMRQDFFYFTPEFKLHVVGNHKPTIRSVDDAIRRRMNLIGYYNSFKGELRDKHLSEALSAEAPGILRWMIEGSLEWRKLGLNPPAIITQETESYLKEEDILGDWLETDCVRDSAGWSGTLQLYQRYTTFLEARREPIPTMRKFAHALEGRGFTSHRKRIGRGFLGLRLKTKAEAAQGLHAFASEVAE